MGNLEKIMAGLQYEESRVGPTKGLGRCAALYHDEWFRQKINNSKKSIHVVKYKTDCKSYFCYIAIKNKMLNMQFWGSSCFQQANDF